MMGVITCNALYYSPDIQCDFLTGPVGSRLFKEEVIIHLNLPNDFEDFGMTQIIRFSIGIVYSIALKCTNTELYRTHKCIILVVSTSRIALACIFFALWNILPR
jgi:hypothetical protein